MKLLPAPIVTNAVINGVIVQTTRPSGAQFFSVDNTKFYTSYDGACSQKHESVILQNNVFRAFRNLSTQCEFQSHLFSCNHKYSKVVCSLKNCPLLD